MPTVMVTNVRSSTEWGLVAACRWKVHQMTTLLAVLSSWVGRANVEARDGT